MLVTLVVTLEVTAYEAAQSVLNAKCTIELLVFLLLTVLILCDLQ